MKQSRAVAYTAARVFAGTLLAALLAAGVGVLDWSTWADWKPVLWAAGAAAATVVINALNPKDTRYGIGA